MRRAPGMPIVLLTNDAEHRRKALAEGIQAVNVQVLEEGLIASMRRTQPRSCLEHICSCGMAWLASQGTGEARSRYGQEKH